MASTWFFQYASETNCVAEEPHMTAKAPSSLTTSGGLGPASRARHAAAPSGKYDEPLLHQSFWPYACSPAAIPLVKLFIALDQEASVGYLLGVAEYPPAAEKVRQLSA